VLPGAKPDTPPLVDPAPSSTWLRPVRVADADIVAAVAFADPDFYLRQVVDHYGVITVLQVERDS
jgi:hypothetical protein